MSSKFYERCPACRGATPGRQCPACRGAKFVETGLTSGQFDLYRRKAHGEYERGLIDGFRRGAAWGEAGRSDFSPGDLDTLAMEMEESLEQIREECRQRREADSLGEPTEAELFEVGAVALTCLDTVACDLADDDLCDYVAKLASRLETVLRKLGWEPKQGEAK